MPSWGFANGFRGVADLLGLPTGTGAGFVTGATMANFTGLAAGRHAARCTAFSDVGAIALLFLMSIWFTVEPEEAGLVLRFGRFVRQVPSGLHAKLPYPLEKVVKVPVYTPAPVVAPAPMVAPCPTAASAG